ncbi:MAG: hypothetical protein U0575_15325 [Phycisphaerales bacterium]
MHHSTRWGSRRVGFLATALLGLCGALGAATFADPPIDASTQVLRGRLISVHFRPTPSAGATDAAEANAPTAQQATAIASILVTGFYSAGHVPGVQVTDAELATSIDLTTLTRDTWDQAIQALLPADVRLGDEVIVAMRQPAVATQLVEMARPDGPASQEMLARWTTMILDSHRRRIDTDSRSATTVLRTDFAQDRPAPADREQTILNAKARRDRLGSQLQVMKAIRASREQATDDLAHLEQVLPITAHPATAELHRLSTECLAALDVAIARLESAFATADAEFRRLSGGSSPR